MPDKDWFEAATNIQALVITLWTVYVAIAGATLALIASGRKALQRLIFRALIAIAYLGSAIVNLFAMLNLRAQHDLLAHHVRDQQLQWHMLQPKTWEYVLIHSLIDVGICIAIMWLPARTDEAN